MTREQFIREAKANRGSWPAIVIVYSLIVGAMVLSGMAIKNLSNRLINTCLNKTGGHPEGGRRSACCV